MRELIISHRSGDPRSSLCTPLLRVEAEEQLHVLLRTRYDWEYLNTFVSLQEAAITGQVRQELRSRAEVRS